MPSAASVKRDLESLGVAGQQAILNYLEEVIMLASLASEVTDAVDENRFSRGKICPHCGHDEVSRNGKFHCKQRYFCKSCRKTFTDYTRYNSKKNLKRMTKLL